MSLRTGVAALVAGLLTAAPGVVAQPFPAGISADEFERMLQERVVTIKVTAKRNADQVPDIAYGNGTIVSPAGMIVTAKHVINAFEDGGHQASTYEVIRRTQDGSFSYDLRLAALHESEYDAVAVPIENAGNLRLPYVCLQPDHMKMPIGSELAMHSYAYWDISANGQPANVWRRVAHDGPITLNAKEGFGDSSNYWAASAEFAPSESGAGILFGGDLIGIVANSLVHWQGNVATPIRGHNYFVPLGLVFQDLRLSFLDNACETGTADEVVRRGQEKLSKQLTDLNEYCAMHDSVAPFGSAISIDEYVFDCSQQSCKFSRTSHLSCYMIDGTYLMDCKNQDDEPGPTTTLSFAREQMKIPDIRKIEEGQYLVEFTCTAGRCATDQDGNRHGKFTVELNDLSCSELLVNSVADTPPGSPTSQ